MRRKRILTMALGIALMLVASAAMAVPITGSINFEGSCSYTGGSTAADATGIHFNYALLSDGSTGAYAGIPSLPTALTFITFQDFSFKPSMDPAPVDPLWTFSYNGITYSFVMTSVAASVSGNSLILNGLGTLDITGTGSSYDPTAGAWTLTTQGSTARISFSSTSTAVPEPGTLTLLGTGILGLCLYGRRRAQA